MVTGSFEEHQVLIAVRPRRKPGSSSRRMMIGGFSKTFLSLPILATYNRPHQISPERSRSQQTFETDGEADPISRPHPV